MFTRPQNATNRYNPAPISVKVQRLEDGLRFVGMAGFYTAMGAVGGVLWVLVQLPLTDTIKSNLAVAMAGCMGACTMGLGMMKQLPGSDR